MIVEEKPVGMSAYERDVRKRIEYAGISKAIPVETEVLRGLIHDLDMWRGIASRERDMQPASRKLLNFTKGCLESAEAEVERLETALEKLSEEWNRMLSFDGLIRVAKRILDERYPASIFDGSSGDSGPAFIVALRAAIEEVEK